MFVYTHKTQNRKYQKYHDIFDENITIFLIFSWNALFQHITCSYTHKTHKIENIKYIKNIVDIYHDIYPANPDI